MQSVQGVHAFMQHYVGIQRVHLFMQHPLIELSSPTRERERVSHVMKKQLQQSHTKSHVSHAIRIRMYLLVQLFEVRV